MQYYISLISLYLFLPVVVFSAPVKDFSATYKLYHNELYVGDSVRILKTSGENITFTAKTETAGLAAIFFSISINETSNLHFKNKQLNFVSYQYDEKNKDQHERYQIYLDQKQVYNSYTKKHYPIAENLQDTLGFTISVMHDLNAGKREITYTIAEKDGIKTYHLKLIKKENLSTNSRVIKTLKMEHYNPQTKHRFTLWCAEEMGYLPIRIRSINHKGDENLFNLSRFNQKEIYLNLEPDEDSE